MLTDACGATSPPPPSTSTLPSAFLDGRYLTTSLRSPLTSGTCMQGNTFPGIGFWGWVDACSEDSVIQTGDAQEAKGTNARCNAWHLSHAGFPAWLPGHSAS